MDDAGVRERIGPWVESGLPDLEAFEADTNFVVQAAAGSGKTTSLVARIVALVRQGVPIEDIAAITFTRKAAGEMSDRLAAELERAQEILRETDPRDGHVGVQRERIQRALDGMTGAFIGTIHAFCARLLRERPAEAGVPPDFVAGIDDRDERRLRERAWSEYVTATWEADRDAFRRLARAGLATDDLFDFFGDLCRYPELDPLVDGPETAPDLDAAVATAHDFVDTWIERRPSTPPDTSPGRALEALETADRFRRYRHLDTPAQQSAYLHLFAGLLEADSRKSTDTDERGRVKLSAWGDARAAAETLRNDALPALVQDTIRPALRVWNAFVHRTAVGFVQPAVERFATLRRQEGMLTFHDLLLLTRDLLRDHPQVRARFQDRYPRLLVDEFQDTDPVQAEILFYLTASNPETTPWTDCEPLPGSLFIVGDDKQSIYRFRRADMAVFQAAGEQVAATGGEQVQLTTNFRSTTALCDWFNRAFRELYAAPDLADVQADYAPFDPHRTGATDPPVYRLSIDKVPGNRPEPIAEAEADRIARSIDAVCRCADDEDGTEPESAPPLGETETRGYGDVLILTRLSKRLRIYAEALAARGIPYTITGSKDLGASPELRALVDLMTCARRPDDSVARVAYLRGSLVGLSDDDLYRYHRAMQAADGETGFDVCPAPRPEIDDPDGLQARLETAFDRIDRVREWLDTLSPSAAVARILDDAGLWAVATYGTGEPRTDGSLRAGALVRVCTLVQQYDAQNLHWTDILDELQRVLDGEEEVDGMTMETGTGQAVRLMNVHQAKGLQAPLVFLADPYDRYHAPSPGEHVRRDDGEIVLPVVRRFGPGRSAEVAAPAAWEAHAEQERRHARAEEVRLQYVAATRAAERLVVSTYTPKDDGFWATLDPYVDAVGAPELPTPDSLQAESPSESVPPDRLSEADRSDEDRSDAGRSDAERLDAVAAMQAMRDDRETRRRSVCAPGYVIETPTSTDALLAAVRIAVEDLVTIGVSQAERERLLQTPYLRSVLAAQGEADIDATRIDRLRRAVQAFLEAEPGDWLRSADAARPQPPIAWTRASEPVAIVRPNVTAALQVGDTWRLVAVERSKDRVEDPSALHLAARAAGVWQEDTGGETTAGVWFVDTGAWEPVSPDAARRVSPTD